MTGPARRVSSTGGPPSCTVSFRSATQKTRRETWSCGAVWSARHPVKVEAAGSNPVRTAARPRTVQTVRGFPVPEPPPDRRPRPRRSRSPTRQIPSGPQSSPVSIIDTGLFRAPPHPRTPAPDAQHSALGAPSPNSPAPRAPRGPQCPSRGLDGVTFARYSKDRASSPCGPLEAAYGGIGQARDAGPAPRASVGRVVVRPCDAALPDLPPAAAARTGRSGAAASRRTVTDGTSRRRRGRERPHGLMPAGPNTLAPQTSWRSGLQ